HLDQQRQPARVHGVPRWIVRRGLLVAPPPSLAPPMDDRSADADLLPRDEQGLLTPVLPVAPPVVRDDDAGPPSLRGVRDRRCRRLRDPVLVLRDVRRGDGAAPAMVVRGGARRAGPGPAVVPDRLDPRRDPPAAAAGPVATRPGEHDAP